MIRFFLTISTLIFSTFILQAQLEKVLHQTFEIGQADKINLDFYGEYEIELWAGNTVMTETQIQLSDASPAILKHFIEVAKRYDVVLNNENESEANFYSHDKVRKEIKTKYGDGIAEEAVLMRIFVPDSFELIDQKSLVRKSKTTDE
jgi:hypothetical protein